jgi:4-amino-4-deoxy-L-arabinose transferase-like glycosyltransferase
MSKKKGKKAIPRSTVQQPAQTSAPPQSPSAKLPAPPLTARPLQTPPAAAKQSISTHVGIAILIAVFLVTRLINLGSYPLHGDEATYIYWGQIAASGPEQRFISMWGGRQPLHTWLVAALVPLVNSILVPARLISVAFGAFTAVGVYLLARKLFSGRVAFIATMLYLLIPYTVQFDRQVFQDGMISTLAIWTLYVGVLIFERPSWIKAIGLGMLIGAGLLTKSTSWLYLPLIVFCILPFPTNVWKSRARQAALPLLAALAIGGVLYYGLFGSAPEARQLGEWASKFTYSISDLLGFPISAWGDNFVLITRWLIAYLTLPVFLMVLAALLATGVWLISSNVGSREDQIARRQLGRKALLLAIWGLVPVLGHVILAKSLYARYIVFAIPPLLILVAVFIDYAGAWLARRPALARFKPAYVIGGLAALVLAAPLFQTALLLLSPQNFNYEVADRTAYYDGALWAAEPLAAEIRRTANGQPTTLFTNFGMNAVLIGEVATLPRDEKIVRPMPLWPVNNNKLYPYDPFTLTPYPPEKLDALRQQRTLYASVPGEEGVMADFSTPLADFPDKTGKVAYRLYQFDFDRYLNWLNQAP